MMNVMLDIETLDTSTSAVILSIGAVKFDIEKPGVLLEAFHEHIDIDTCVASGRTMSGNTILWWLEQSEAARTKLLAATRIPLNDALLKLSTFIGRDDRVWGNGAAFDNAILADAYRKANIPLPWRYYNDRCYRTLKNMYPDVAKPDTGGVDHDALDDAVKQALHLQNIFEYMNKVPA